MLKNPQIGGLSQSHHFIGTGVLKLRGLSQVINSVWDGPAESYWGWAIGNS